MPNLGAHMSVEGGIHRACERGREAGCNVIQLFTKNQRQWKSRELLKNEITAFQKAKKQNKIKIAFAHDTYLINLATSQKELWRKSLEGFLDDIKRAEQLSLTYLVTHPGSPGKNSEKLGIKNMARAFNQIHKATRLFQVQILLETTAGQGYTLGYKFEHLRELTDHMESPERVGICFDTCHVFASGYDIRTRKGYEKTMSEFDRIIGLNKLKAFHLNDSKKDLGSRVDRHEHIGQGYLGIEVFRCLMNDVRFQETPMVLETPKTDHMDEKNLALLRSLRKI